MNLGRCLAMLAIIAPVACATTAAARVTPTRSQVVAALDYELNSMCGGALESENCISHPSRAAVRALRCSPGERWSARCRYELRVTGITSQTRWRRAEGWFRDLGREGWILDRQTELEPDEEDVEEALRQEGNRFCVSLIDACLDEEGNALYQEIEVEVSDLRCSPRGERRVACTFSAARDNGPQETCFGTLAAVDDAAERDWSFMINPRRELASAVRCN